MKIILSTFVLLYTFAVFAFSPQSTASLRFGRADFNERSIFNQRITKRVLANTKSDVNTEVPVSRILVCTGELCQCQGEKYGYEGGAADAVINELQSMGLPFPVEDTGCMGACGIGTMVAIDFVNGASIMIDGLDSTLAELGIQKQDKFSSLPKTGIMSPESKSEEVTNSDTHDETTLLTDAILESTTEHSKQVVNQISKSNKEKLPLLADTRERMRQEAASSEAVENPWLKLGSYLAKKATDKIFSSQS